MYEKNLACQDLCGLFYSIFNDNLGRINFAQYPPDFFPPEMFSEIENFVITKEDFANRVIVSEVGGKIVIGCLQSLENSKYPRNKFLFNVCFVVRDTCENIISYENLVRNVNRFFHSLEQETGALHCAEESMIRTCLENIYCNLIRAGVCKYTWEGFGTIYLKICTTPSVGIVVDKEQVPVYLLNDKERLVPLDLACQRLSPLLDGTRHIYDVARDCQVDLKVALACVQNLGHIGVVRTVSQYRLSSSYVCMPRLSRLSSDRHLCGKLLEYVLRADITNVDDSEQMAIAETALRALALLSPATTVRDCYEMLASHYPSMDCKLLIQFAEAEGLIRRLHSYPLAGPGVGSVTDKLTDSMMDGSHSVEELSCLLDTAFGQLEDDLRKMDDVVMITK